MLHRGVFAIKGLCVGLIKEPSRKFCWWETWRTKYSVFHVRAIGPIQCHWLGFVGVKIKNTIWYVHTRFFLYKHHHYKHRQPQIWPKIKHHLSTSLSLTSLQHTNFVYANYFNFPIISVKINLSYNFGALNYSSLQIFKFLWLGYVIDEHDSLSYSTGKVLPYFSNKHRLSTIWG